MTTSDQPTLYERIGGEQGIVRLIDAFYDRILADPELAGFFQDTAMDTLRRMQREFIAAALGATVSYSGRPLGQAHAGRGITPKHLQRFVAHLFDTLRADFDLQPDDESAIVDRIWTLANDVTGNYGVDV